jgi:hypothetical protein
MAAALKDFHASALAYRCHSRPATLTLKKKRLSGTSSAVWCFAAGMWMSEASPSFICSSTTIHASRRCLAPSAWRG